MSDTAVSERISVCGNCLTGAVDPHWLAALALTVIGHAGGAQWRCCDLASHDSVGLGSCDKLVASLPGCRWRRERRHEQQRGHNVQGLHCRLPLMVVITQNSRRSAASTNVADLAVDIRVFLIEGLLRRRR